MMLPRMDLPSMSWVLLSCLMLLSQVQGELSLFLTLVLANGQGQDEKEDSRGTGDVYPHTMKLPKTRPSPHRPSG